MRLYRVGGLRDAQNIDMQSSFHSIKNRFITTFAIAVFALTTASPAAYGYEPGDFNTCATQGREFEQAGRYVDALISYGAALRLNPSSMEVRQKQAEIYNKLTSGNQQAGSAGDMQEQQAVRAMFADFVNVWNNHDIGGLRRLMDNDFFTADGLTYNQIIQLAQQTWQMYPTAKTYFDIKSIRVNGDYAEAETMARLVGSMAYIPSIGASGDMRSTIHDLFALKKTNKGWKLSGQYIVEEFVNITFGNVNNINAHLTVPNTMAPGQPYTANVDVLLPAGTTATVGLAQSTPAYPIVEPAFSYVQLAGPSMAKQFTSNLYGRNEDVAARINVSNGYTGQAMGMIWLSKRVNLIDTVNMIASAPPNTGSAYTSTPANTSRPQDSRVVSPPAQVASIQTPPAQSRVISTPPSGSTSVPDDTTVAKASTRADRPIRDKWAIIVGIDNFEDQKIPKLRYSTKDAIDFYKFLETSGNFKRDHMRLLLNEKATQRRILTELATLFLHRVAEPDDLVVVFFSTHGSPTEEGPGGNNYLVAYDTSIDELFATGVSMQAIMSTLKERINSDRILLVLDACHSGATTVGAKGMTRAANFDAESIAQGSGQLVICSSEPSERSWESKRAPNGVFTKKLMEGLTKNGPNTRLADAFSYLQSQVQKEVKEDRGAMQKPILKSKWNGAELLPLVAPTAPQPLPNSLKEQLPPDSSAEVK
jgi:hypothetical protein